MAESIERMERAWNNTMYWDEPRLTARSLLVRGVLVRPVGRNVNVSLATATGYVNSSTKSTTCSLSIKNQ